MYLFYNLVRNVRLILNQSETGEHPILITFHKQIASPSKAYVIVCNQSYIRTCNPDDKCHYMMLLPVVFLVA